MIEHITPPPFARRIGITRGCTSTRPNTLVSNTSRHWSIGDVLDRQVVAFDPRVVHEQRGDRRAASIDDGRRRRRDAARAPALRPRRATRSPAGSDRARLGRRGAEDPVDDGRTASSAQVIAGARSSTPDVSADRPQCRTPPTTTSPMTPSASSCVDVGVGQPEDAGEHVAVVLAEQRRATCGGARAGRWRDGTAHR